MEPEETAALSANEHPWYALRVRPSCERVASFYLKERGYVEFVPTYRVTRQWSDRRKQTEAPLFPGYVFCRLNPHDRLPVLMAPGVMHILGFGREPMAIPDVEIERIEAMVRSGLQLMPWPNLQVGDTVYLERGPLAGLEGRLERVKGQCRIVVSLTLLQQGVSAEVDLSWVRPVKRSVTAPARRESESGARGIQG